MNNWKLVHENEELDDTKSRVAVIITDGENAIVGKSPQNMRKEFSCCDLMKGHAQEGESLEDAAKREALEECGLSLTNLTRLTPPLKYSKGTTLTFFVSKMSQLPDPSSLECQSFYEYNGRQFPEITQYLSIPLDELPNYLYKGLAKLVVDNNLISMVKDDEDDLVLERIEDDEYDDEDDDILSIEDCAELLQSEDWSEILNKEDDEVEVLVKQVNKKLTVIQINTPDPKATRKYMVNVVGPDLGLQFAVPRKTKKDGYTLGIIQDDIDEVYIIILKKGGNHRAGRKNELGFQNFIKSQLQKNGECKMSITDNYGVKVDLDIVEVIDSAAKHGTNGEVNRSDTTVRLKDGTIYGISHKKTNATYVCKVKKMFKEIKFRSEQILRQYAKEHGMKKGDYMDIRITQRDLIDLCWFGTDIAKGAAFIGDFEDLNTPNPTIERIIRNGDTDVLTSFPIYVKWKIVNGSFKMVLQGVSVASKGGAWVIDDVKLPGINAPMADGRQFKIGQEEPKKRRKKIRRSRVTEDMVNEEQLMEEARQNDMWDTVALCAENHKMLWLKYETVEDAEIISRKVAPYSYRTRNTKTRGRSTYFYADDFTPGQEHGIKCFLIENCLQVKESRQSFTPRWPVEIKAEIDKLEKQRQDDEEKKEQQKKVDQERPDVGNDNEIVDDNEVKKDVKKGMSNRDAERKHNDVEKQEQKKEAEPPKKQPIKLPKPEIPASQPSTPKPQKPAPQKQNDEPPMPKSNPNDKDIEVTDVKTTDKDDDGNQVNDEGVPDEGQSNDNSVELGDIEDNQDGEEAVQVTNDDGEELPDQK